MQQRHTLNVNIVCFMQLNIKLHFGHKNRQSCKTPQYSIGYFFLAHQSVDCAAAVFFKKNCVEFCNSRPKPHAKRTLSPKL